MLPPVSTSVSRVMDVFELRQSSILWVSLQLREGRKFYSLPIDLKQFCRVFFKEFELLVSLTKLHLPVMDSMLSPSTDSLQTDSW